jgi:hypothetical protein
LATLQVCIFIIITSPPQTVSLSPSLPLRLLCSPLFAPLAQKAPSPHSSLVRAQHLPSEQSSSKYPYPARIYIHTLHRSAMTALVGLSLPRLPVTAAGESAVAHRPSTPLGHLLPWLPREPLTLALLTVFGALFVLAFVLRSALPSAHSKHLRLDAPLVWARIALVKFVELLEDDEDEEAELEKRRQAILISRRGTLPRSGTPVEKATTSSSSANASRTWTLDGTSYRLPSVSSTPVPPKAARPTQRGVPLASPPAPQFTFAGVVPPPAPVLPRQPLSAAKMIMSRHVRSTHCLFLSGFV